MSVLEHIMAFKSVYTLSAIRKDNSQQVTHYVCCLVHGREPLWGIWNVNGKFIQFAGSRGQVSDLYPNRAWGRVMASWALVNADKENTAVVSRIRKLEETYGKRAKRGAA